MRRESEKRENLIGCLLLVGIPVLLIASLFLGSYVTVWTRPFRVDLGWIVAACLLGAGFWVSARGNTDKHKTVIWVVGAALVGMMFGTSLGTEDDPPPDEATDTPVSTTTTEVPRMSDDEIGELISSLRSCFPETLAVAYDEGASDGSFAGEAAGMGLPPTPDHPPGTPDPLYDKIRGTDYPCRLAAEGPYSAGHVEDTILYRQIQACVSHGFRKADAAGYRNGFLIAEAESQGLRPPDLGGMSEDGERLEPREATIQYLMEMAQSPC